LTCATSASTLLAALKTGLHAAPSLAVVLSESVAAPLLDDVK